MNSKERVLRTFDRREADRVPINYHSNPGIDGRLKAHFGLKPDDYDGLRQKLGVDFVGVGAPYKGKRLYEDVPERGVKVDNWGIHRKWVEHDSGGYWDYCDFPLEHAAEEEIAGWLMPNPDDFDYSGISQDCEKYSQYAIHGSGGYGDIINGNGMLRGMEQTLIDLVTDDPAGLLLAERRMEIQIEITRRTLESGKGKIDFVWLGEDLGTQNGQMISMDIFRKHIRPRYQKYIDLAKTYGAKVMMHSCGSSSWAYEDFIEMGIDVVDTLQPEAKNMSPEYLKKTFGDRLAFHGCISTAGVLAYGTPDEVTRNVRETLEIMKPGGGYILAPTHSIQDNTPVENVIAMYEAAKRYGVYGK